MKSPEKQMIYCPRCGSSKVRWVLPQLWGIYDCPECGYRGSVVVQDGGIASKIRENWVKGHR